jgi:hypothetical protein
MKCTEYFTCNGDTDFLEISSIGVMNHDEMFSVPTTKTLLDNPHTATNLAATLFQLSIVVH